MSLHETARPTDTIFDTLCNMGFTDDYVHRSLKLYEKHYNIIKQGYDTEIIREIIFRLNIKDKLKQSQIIYYSKVNLKQALEIMNFSSYYISIAIEQYETIYGPSSYDIKLITQNIMNLRANDYRRKKQIKLPNNSRISLDTNSTGDTPQIENTITQTIQTIDNNNNNYTGYLWKQSSKQKKKWQKRWFVLTYGSLQYFKDCEKATKFFSSENGSYKNRKEYIGQISLCNVHKVTIDKHKYVISITTPSQRTYLLETFDINEYNKWFNVLSSKTQSETNQFLCNGNYDSYKSSITNNIINDDIKCDYNGKKQLLLKIINDNKLCADCNKLSPEWISINIGVVICFQCAAIHRDLGCNISKVRSLMLDNLDGNILKYIINIGGNKKLNEQLLEYNLNKLNKINYNCNNKERKDFIYCKYVKKMYINRNKLVWNLDLNQYLFNCALSNDCFGIIFALYNGADINYSFREKNDITALQVAILKSNNEVERLLIVNDALPMVQI